MIQERDEEKALEGEGEANQQIGGVVIRDKIRGEKRFLESDMINTILLGIADNQDGRKIDHVLNPIKRVGKDQILMEKKKVKDQKLMKGKEAKVKKEE